MYWFPADETGTQQNRILNEYFTYFLELFYAWRCRRGVWGITNLCTCKLEEMFSYLLTRILLMFYKYINLAVAIILTA